MGWRTILEGTEQEAELRLRLLRRKAQETEVLALQGPVVDPDGPPADLHAVDDQVVGISMQALEHLAVVAVHLVDLLRLGGGEGVVHGIEAVGVVIPLQEGEVEHPEGLDHAGGHQTEAAAHLQTQFPELLAYLVRLSAEHQEDVARAGTEALAPAPQGLVVEELADRALDRAVGVEPHIHQTLGADLGALHPVGEVVELLVGPLVGHPLGADAGDELGPVEDAKTPALAEVVKLFEGHVEAQVRLVGAIQAHGIVVGHAGEVGQGDAVELLIQVFGQPFEGVEDILAGHEGHLAVDLGELRLAVGPQVLVAEALDDLEVAVHAGHHEDLLEGLGRLGQGVELTRVHAAGHYEVARPFRGALDEAGRLDLHELLLVEVFAGLDGDLGPEAEVALQGLPADVQVAVLEAKVVAPVGIRLDGKGRGLGAVQHLQGSHLDLDVAGGAVGVLVAPLLHGAGHLDDELAPQLAGMLTEGGVGVHVEHQLGDAIAIAQVDEGEATQVAADLHPSAEGDGAVEVGQAQGATVVCSVHRLVLLGTLSRPKRGNPGAKIGGLEGKCRW